MIRHELILLSLSRVLDDIKSLNDSEGYLTRLTNLRLPQWITEDSVVLRCQFIAFELNVYHVMSENSIVHFPLLGEEICHERSVLITQQKVIWKVTSHLD